VKLRLVTVETEGAINLGFIARLTVNFDVDQWMLVSPKANLHEAEQYAAKAVDALRRAMIVEKLEDALTGVEMSACTSAVASRGDDVLRVPITPSEFAQLAASARGVVAVVMGRESTGLTRRELSLCDVMVNIPSSHSYRALNLANATAIVLYELYKIRSGNIIPRKPPPRDVRVLLESYASELASLTISDKAKASEVTLAFKRLFSRCDLSLEEARRILFLLSRATRRLKGADHEWRQTPSNG